MKSYVDCGKIEVIRKFSEVGKEEETTMRKGAIWRVLLLVFIIGNLGTICSAIFMVGSAIGFLGIFILVVIIALLWKLWKS